MLPNHFILLWDGYPVGLMGSFPVTPYPAKIFKNPGRVEYFETRREAQDFADKFPEKKLLVKEIQFRIMGVN